MTNLSKTYTNQLKRKQFDDDDDDDDSLQTSIFDILENEFQIGDIVWAKLNGYSWWPAFVYGCFSKNWKYVKINLKSELPSNKQYFVYCFGVHFRHAWVNQACLYRYKGLDEFLNYSENQVEQATTTCKEQRIRKKIVQISKELHPLWNEAIKEADEVLALPIDLRIAVYEKRLHRLLAGTKYSIPEQRKEQETFSDNSSKRTVSNNVTASSSMKRLEVSSETVGKSTFSSTRKETEQSTKSQSKSFFMPMLNELDTDVVIVKFNTPAKSTSLSLTTAICHFLDKGIPSLTVYEEIHLVNELNNHQLGSSLTLTDAQLYVEQYIINTASRNFCHRMAFVQSDFFYDFLLKYPQVILKHRQWFKDFKQTLMPIDSDKILLKKWQLATLLHAHMNLEQSSH